MQDCGEVTAKSISQWFHNSDNLNILHDLLQYIEFKEETKVETNTNGVFNGMSLYCTGTFACGKKDELKKMVEDNGGTFASGYAKSLSYLVIGSLKGSSKEDKAKKDEVKILSEEQFLNMIGR